MINVSVVSYRSLDLVTSLVNQLRSQSSESRQVRLFVSINDEQAHPEVAQLKPLMEARDDPEIIVHSPMGNIGLGQGHARALPYLERGDWLWCINPDISLDREYLMRADAAVRRLDHETLLAGVPIAAGRTGGEARDFPRPTGRNAIVFIARCLGIPAKTLPDSHGTYGVHGAMFAIRRDPRLPEPFDPRVFLFYEEQILAEKVRRCGAKAALLTTTPLRHEVGVSRARAGKRLTKEFLHAQKIYLTDYLGWTPVAATAIGAITRIRLEFSRGV